MAAIWGQEEEVRMAGTNEVRPGAHREDCSACFFRWPGNFTEGQSREDIAASESAAGLSGPQTMLLSPGVELPIPMLLL